MTWNPSPEVAVARNAAEKLKASIGCIVIYLTEESIGMASYGPNKALCNIMGQLGDQLHKKAIEYFEEEV